MGVGLPVSPAEPGELTAAHAGGGGEMQRWVEPQVGGARQVMAELAGGPDFWVRIGRVVGRAVRSGERDVGGDEAASCGVSER